MYKIETTDYGYRLTFDDFMSLEEMKKWTEDSKKKLVYAPHSFHVFIDMRSLKTLPQKSQEMMREGQKFYKERGMQRSVVVVDSIITLMQFRRIAKESGIYDWEKYVDSATDPDWEEHAMDWIIKGIDPDE